MLLSFQQAIDSPGLPEHTRRFADAANQLDAPQGLVLSPQSFESFLDSYGLRSEIQGLLDAITDQESIERVETEVSRRIVTGRIDGELAEQISEAQEILSMDEQLNVSDIPLVALLSTDHHIQDMPVIVNVVGKKALADAIRTLWSRSFVHPYPDGIPKCSIILYRMPPVLSTATVQVGQDIHVEAVEGWGQFVNASAVSDEFTFSLQGTIQNKEIRSQDTMVHRNPRTGEMVQTSPKRATAQAVTDDIAEKIARSTKRVGLQKAVYGIGEKKHWLLSVGDALQARQAPPEEQPQEAPKEEAEQPHEPEPAIEIIEIDEDEEPAQVIVEEAEPEKEFDDPMDSGDEVPQGEDAVRTLSEQLLVSVHQTIENILRDWLHGSGPDEYAALVNTVGSKRVVPYKSRLLTLDEMRQHGAFDDPSPEAVRFALETLQRFRKEF